MKQLFIRNPLPPAEGQDRARQSHLGGGSQSLSGALEDPARGRQIRGTRPDSESSGSPPSQEPSGAESSPPRLSGNTHSLVPRGTIVTHEDRFQGCRRASARRRRSSIRFGSAVSL